MELVLHDLLLPPHGLRDPGEQLLGRDAGLVADAVAIASRRVLLGIVPVSTQTPPTSRRFSTTAARFPSLAAWIAARCPAGPLPMQMRSKS
jgi:hypothetical protein